VRQCNDVLCYFAKLSPVVKLRLLYSYCSSLHGSELWLLGSREIDAIGVSWRKALKRVWNLPALTHSNILYALCDKWPIEDEICRRSLRFIISCLTTDCSVVCSVARMCLTYFPAKSFIGSNLLYIGSKYDLNVYRLLGPNSDVSILKNLTNKKMFKSVVCCGHDHHAVPTHLLNLVCETIFIRNGSFYLDFEHQYIEDIIVDICTE